MFSGGDSSGDGVNSRNQFNWQITSQTSCNINSGGTIDWASLAQQWIQMKDSGAGLPDTPPPPMIGTNSRPNKIHKFDEQGEADMEVENDDEQKVVAFGQNNSPPATNNLNSNRWFSTQQEPAAAAAYCAPQQTPWTSWPARVALPPPTLHVPITTGSLTPPILKETVSTTPPLQNNQKNGNDAAALLPHKESLEPAPMDAAKRKILPAWIREGLEKMEREKLKQLEREQKEPQAAGTPVADSDINNTFKSMVKSSITEMEGDSSGNEANESANADTVPYEDIDDPDAVVATVNSHLPTATSVHQERISSGSGKTYEERLSDMMIAVRKNLTELLLEVTNEEISSIAHETIRKRRAKGLEAYADSDSDNSASDDEANHDESKRSDDDNDSEEELKANIRICKRAFAKTIEDIEERIQASAMRDEHLLREHQKKETKDHGTDYNRSPTVRKIKGFDTEIGEPQPDKKSSSNGKRRKERTSRFSDNKDSRHRMAPSYYPPSSLGSGNLPSPVLPGASATLPTTNVIATKYKTSNSAASSVLAASSVNEKRSSNSSSSANKSSKPPQTSVSSSSSRHRRPSASPSYSSDSSSSDTRSSHSRRSKYSGTHRSSKRCSTERSKRSHRSSSHRSSRRRDSSDSNDEDHYKKRSSRHRSHKSGSSSVYSRRHDRRRSDSRSSHSQTRSRSRSRSTTYSSSRRNDRY